MKQTAIKQIIDFIEQQEYNFLNKEQLESCKKILYKAKELLETETINEWQQEKMYSEEDMKSAFKVGFSIGYGSDVHAIDEKNRTCEEWFEQFKMKQTAVEWLEEQMPTAFKNLTINKNLIEQAKEMERQQERSYSEEEVEFIGRLITFFWIEHNSEHPDNLTEFELSKSILKQFKKK